MISNEELRDEAVDATLALQFHVPVGYCSSSASRLVAHRPGLSRTPLRHRAGASRTITKGGKLMISLDISRREFLLNSGLAVATAAAIAGGLAGIDPAWALTTKAIDPETARGLLGMTRVLYPHAILSDAYYGKAVEALDAGAAADPAFATMLRDGVAKLGAPY